MANVSALPFMLGIIGGVLLFVAWLPMAIRESRRPYRWPETRPSAARARRVAAELRLVEPSPKVERPARVEPQVVAPRFALRSAPRRGHGTARLAIVVAAFTVWSFWSLRSRVDHR
jgi:hypothetical protein